LRYNPDLQVLGIVTGEGKSHAAASIMGPGMDPRFDLSKAYWIIAAIAGVDPKKVSVASTAWAKFVVDGDLSYQIDAREIPRSWSTGYVPPRSLEPLSTTLSIIQFQWCSTGLPAQCLSRRLGFPVDPKHPIAR
jgi:purine nucleoside permease